MKSDIFVLMGCRRRAATRGHVWIRRYQRTDSKKVTDQQNAGRQYLKIRQGGAYK